MNDMLKNIVKFVRIIPMLQPFEQRYPNTYLGFACMVNAIAYAFLAFFPLLSIILFFGLFTRISAAVEFTDWLFILIHLGVMVISGIISFFMVTSRFSPPSGVELDWEQPVKFIDKILELSERYSCNAIDHVIFTQDYSISIIQTPRFGSPVFNHKTLCIGLPVMLSLSAYQFEGTLARTIGQFSGQHSLASSWIYRSLRLWRSYLFSYKFASSIFHKPLFYFFSFYCPFVESICFFALQRCERESDHYALDILSDNDVVALMSANIINMEFLEKRFWPKIHSLVRKQPAAPDHLPFSSMTKVLQHGLTHEDKTRWLEQAFKTNTDFSNYMPSLSDRMYALGHENIIVPENVEESAAKYYLGAYEKEVVNTMDKAWLHRLQLALEVKNKNKITAENAANEDPHTMQLQKLQYKIKHGTITYDELFEFAMYTAKVDGNPAALKIYQLILKKRPDHVKTVYNVGRHLLSNNDAAGIKVLQKAISMNESCQAPACRMIAKYYKQTGNIEEAQRWESKAST